MLTDEMLASGSECGRHKCNDCEMERVCKSGAYPCANICRAVLAERKERENNPGVWDKAPADATFASVHYCPRAGEPYKLADKHHFFYRELPKTKAREIAEKWAQTPTPEPTRKYLVDIIESAIIEAQGGDK